MELLKHLKFYDKYKYAIFSKLCVREKTEEGGGKCPWKLEDRLGFPGTGSTGSCEVLSVGVGAGLRSIGRTTDSLNH